MRLFIVLLLCGLQCGSPFPEIPTNIDRRAPWVLFKARDAGDASEDACAIVSQTETPSQRDLPAQGCNHRKAPCLVLATAVGAIELSEVIYQYLFRGTGFGYFFGHWKQEMKSMRSDYDEMLNDLAHWSDLQAWDAFWEDPLNETDGSLKYVNATTSCVKLLGSLLPVLQRGTMLLQRGMKLIHRFDQVRPLDEVAKAASAAASNLQRPHSPHPLPSDTPEPVHEPGLESSRLAARISQLIFLAKQLQGCIQAPVDVSCRNQALEDLADNLDAASSELTDLPILLQLQIDAAVPPLLQTSSTQQKQVLLDLVRAAAADAQHWKRCMEKTSCTAMQEEEMRGRVASLFISVVQYNIHRNWSAEVGHEAAADPINISAAVETLYSLAREAEMKSKSQEEARLEVGKEEEDEEPEPELQHRQQWSAQRATAVAAIAAAAMMLPALFGAWRRRVNHQMSFAHLRSEDLHALLLPVDNTHCKPARSSCTALRMQAWDFVACLAFVGLWGLLLQFLWLLAVGAASNSGVEGGGRPLLPSGPCYAYWASFANIAGESLKEITRLGEDGNITSNMNHIVPELLERIAMMSPG